MKRTIILTGASDGIGAAAAKRLAMDNNTLILVGRNPEKIRAVADPLGCTYLTADFGDLSQVRDLAARIKEKVPRIDVLINNAGGIFGAVREETVDGYEKTFQVNHLSPFLLTNLLLDELAEGEGVVVNTASLGAKLFSELDMDDLNLQHHYSSTRAYGNSKLANILFAKELSVRFADRGIFGVSYHPGSIGSNIGTGTTGLAGRFYSSRLLKPFLRSTNYGADRMVYLVNGRLGVDFIPGGYYQNDRPAKSAPLAADPNAASELWEKSAEMVGVLV